MHIMKEIIEDMKPEVERGKRPMLKWSHDNETRQVEIEIAKRANAMAAEVSINYPRLDAMMDIDACHMNDCPLKLQELLQADDFNFAHDVFGIRAHINRHTGKLMDCFVPRYAA